MPPGPCTASAPPCRTLTHPVLRQECLVGEDSHPGTPLTPASHSKRAPEAVARHLLRTKLGRQRDAESPGTPGYLKGTTSPRYRPRWDRRSYQV